MSGDGEVPLQNLRMGLAPRRRREGPGVLWVAACVLLQSSAAVLAKQAGLASAGRGALAIVCNPWYMAELLALSLHAVCWVMALRRLPLSFAYPLMSLVLPINLVHSRFIFKEPLDGGHVMGTFLIVIGTVLLAREVVS